MIKDEFDKKKVEVFLNFIFTLFIIYYLILNNLKKIIKRIIKNFLLINLLIIFSFSKLFSKLLFLILEFLAISLLFFRFSTFILSLRLPPV